MKGRDKDRVQEDERLSIFRGSRGQVKTLEPWNPRTLNPNRESREIALLILAVLLVMVYLLKERPIHPQDQPLQTYPQGHPVYVEIADEKGEMVYTFEGKTNEVPLSVIPAHLPSPDPSGEKVEKVKTGTKITMGPDGLSTDIMDGEKHLVLGIPLDINKATARDFEALPGIGPKLAERIVETRTQLGGFKSPDDLKQVKGIGEGKLEKIRRYIE